MASAPKPPPTYQWTKTVGEENFVLTSDQTNINHAFLKECWKSEEMYWTTPLPDDQWDLMFQNTLCLSLYLQKNPDPSTGAGNTLQQVGFGRIITDYITIAYLTDVFIDPAMRGKGLGIWMMESIKEIEKSMPHLRRMVLMTKAGGPAIKLYEKVLGMHVFESGMEDKVTMMSVPGH